MSPSPLAARRTAGVWTGKELVIWGGRNIVDTKYFTDGAAYDPATDKWRMLPPVNLSARDRIGAGVAFDVSTANQAGASKFG